MPANTDYNIALLIAIMLCWAGVRVRNWWAAGGRFSPTGRTKPPDGVKTQASTVLTPGFDPAADGSGGGAGQGGRPRTAGGDLDAWVAAQPASASRATLIRRAAAKFGASVSTVKRSLRRARNGGQET